MTSIDDVLGGRYRLVRLLGQGGMADVYEAFDHNTQGSVALKIVRSGDPEFLRRLTQEAIALESFEHPGLIRLLDTGFEGDQAFLVMEFIDGQTLAQLLRAGALGSQETAVLGARLADALAYVHDRGIVHRDVKPSNILMTSNGEACLGDFGIARLSEASTLTATGTTIGTVSYMAPEQLEDHQVGPAADMWSLGIVLLECLMGRRVYDGTPSEVFARRMAGPVPIPFELPAPWKLVLSGMLDHQPDQRLEGVQVSALLASSVFDVAWRAPQGDVTERIVPLMTPDFTARIPGLVTDSPRSNDETRVVQRQRPTSAPRRNPRWNSRWNSRWVSRWASRIVAIVALGLGLFFALVSNAASPRAVSSTHPPVVTHAPTTTVSIGSAALDKLVSDISAGEVAQSIAASTGKTIVQEATLAPTDYAAGLTVQAANDLQQADFSITNGIQNGLIAPSESPVLQSDLASLANSLNLNSALPTNVTTPTVAPGPGPGAGNGHGKNH